MCQVYHTPSQAAGMEVCLILLEGFVTMTAGMEVCLILLEGFVTMTAGTMCDKPYVIMESSTD